MSRFEDNLWTRLETEHTPALSRSVAAQRRRTTVIRMVAAAAGVAVLGGVGVVAPAYLGGTPPAYAVVENPDGTVTLTVRDLKKLDEATAELRQHGVNVVAVPVVKECPPEEVDKLELKGKLVPTGSPGGDGVTLTFEPGAHDTAATVLVPDAERNDILSAVLDEVPLCVVGVPPWKTITESVKPVATR